MSTETATLPSMDPPTAALDALIDRAAAAVDARAMPSVFVPRPEEFVDEAGETVAFLPAADIERLANRLIAQHERFAHLTGLTLDFLWKAEGGSSGGHPTLGKCQKPGGLLKHYSRADFIVWLAADHIRLGMMSQRQIEATLYHHLRYAGMDEHGKPCIVTPHLVAFVDELDAYGLWNSQWREAGAKVRQLHLPESGQR